MGSHVVACARAQGHEVDTFSLSDGQDIRVFIPDLSGYDLVIIESAVTAEGEFRKDSFGSFATNILGLLNILEACKKAQVPKVAFASSSAVYGLTDKPSKESDPTRPHNFYAASKAMGETLFQQYQPNGVILRYFNTYGPGEKAKGGYKSIISIFLESIREKGRVVVYGDGEQKRDFIHVEDVARITFELATRALGTFNVGTGKATSCIELIRILKSEGLSFETKHIPNPIPAFQLFTEADVSKLKSEGLEARMPLEDGIAGLIRSLGL